MVRAAFLFGVVTLVACGTRFELDPGDATGGGGAATAGAGGVGATGGGGVSAGGSNGDGGKGGRVAAYVGEVLQDNPLFYFRLNERSSTTITSLTGPVTGTLNGAYTQGVEGATADQDGALKLNHVSMAPGVVVVSNDAALKFEQTKPFTIELWLRVDFHSAGLLPGLVSNQQNPEGQGWTLAMDGSGKINFQRFRDGNVDQIETDSGVPTDRWMHIVASFDGDIMRLFRDSILEESAPSSRDIVATVRPITIGAKGSTFQGLNGIIDEVAVYDYALPPPRITVHFAAASR